VGRPLRSGRSVDGFAQIPLNFLESGGTADYIVNGAGEKAPAEARTIKAVGAASRASRRRRGRR
jgi:hypothetical protein